MLIDDYFSEEKSQFLEMSQAYISDKRRCMCEKCKEKVVYCFINAH